MSTSDKNKSDQVLDTRTTAAISEAITQHAPTIEQTDSMKKRIFARIQHSAPEGVTTIREHEGEWIEVAPKLHMKVLRRDQASNSQTALWRLEPGAVIPAHPHPVEEECMVLKGEINFAEHILREGDFEVVSAGLDHTAMESKTGALVLLRSDIPEDLSWIE